MNCIIISSNLVRFTNVHNFVIHSVTKCNSKLTIEYIVDHIVKVTGNDWVALFPEDCTNFNTIDVKQMITHEFVLPEPVEKTKEEKRYKIQFSLVAIKKLNFGLSYKFVYYNEFSEEVIGISDPFKFLESNPREVYPVPKIDNQTNFDSKVVVKENQYKQNKNGKPTKSSVQNGPKEVQVRNENVVDDQERNYGRNNKRNRLSSMNKMDCRGFSNPFNDSRLFSTSKEFVPSCSNCYRVKALLSKQTELYSQVKNLAEMNSDLNQQNCWLKNQLELVHAAYQKLSVTLMHEQEWKMFYQAAVQERACYQYQVMMVDQMHPDFYTVVDPPVNVRHHAVEKSKLGSAMKLKAIIGRQEEKIRSLTKELEEIKGSKAQKVKAIVTDIENLKLDSNM